MRFWSHCECQGALCRAEGLCLWSTLRKMRRSGISIRQSEIPLYLNVPLSPHTPLLAERSKANRLGHTCPRFDHGRVLRKNVKNRPEGQEQTEGGQVRQHLSLVFAQPASSDTREGRIHERYRHEDCYWNYRYQVFKNYFDECVYAISSASDSYLACCQG